MVLGGSMAKHKDLTDPDTPFAMIINDLSNPENRHPNHKKDVWELCINNFGLKTIDPNKYFITTGEAIRKTERLVEDYIEMVNKAKRLLAVLEKVKGNNEYLETRHQESTLIVLAKNSRKKKKLEREMRERIKRNGHR